MKHEHVVQRARGEDGLSRIYGKTDAPSKMENV